ncbi:MAG: CoA activase [Desulfobacterales bacterium]|nr:CoA activase [Desulfobacterales bacterium]
METGKVVNFQSLSKNVGRFNFRDKIILIPEMNRVTSRLIAATFRGYGINAKVMDTYKGIDLGVEYTSGKECYPCQITTGDILYFMENEKERLGHTFDPENYVYFMPQAEGPCRFGMYNKYQRIVLDSVAELNKVKIGAISTEDGYSLDGIIEEDRVRGLRKTSYFAVIVADIIERLLWRVRPYEKETGMTDDFINESLQAMEKTFEKYGGNKDFDAILESLEKVLEDGKTIIDFTVPPKPLIGLVGEIYLRTHTQANQDVIRTLEKYGAEVINASIAEWVNFTTYGRLREAKIGLRLALKQLNFRRVKDHLLNILNFGGDLLYQEFRQKQVYKRARAHVDLAQDHKVSHLERILEEDDLFSFDVGTEACLSIAGIIEYVRGGYNGIVNIYPFTCMPSTITSAISKPFMNKLGIPYLDTPYDSSVQPGREAAIRTFMYQTHQHIKRHRTRAMN